MISWYDVCWICSLPKHLQLPPPLSSLPPPPSLLSCRLSRASFDRTLEAGDDSILRAKCKYGITSYSLPTWMIGRIACWMVWLDTEKRGVHGGYIIWDDVNLIISPLHSLSPGQSIFFGRICGWSKVFDLFKLASLVCLGPLWWVYFQAQNQLILFVW